MLRIRINPYFEGNIRLDAESTFLAFIGLFLCNCILSQDLIPTTLNGYFEFIQSEFKNNHAKSVHVRHIDLDLYFGISEMDDYIDVNSTFGALLNYHKTNLQLGDSYNRDIEASFLVAKHLYNEFYGYDKINYTYKTYLVDYLRFLQSRGLDFNDIVKSKRFKKARLFSNIYDLASYDLSFEFETSEMLGLFTGSDSPRELMYDYPNAQGIGMDDMASEYVDPGLLDSRIVVLEAFEEVGINIDQNEMKNKKYPQTLREGLIAQSIENDGFQENVAFIDYLLNGQSINEIRLFGYNIFSFSITGTVTPVLNPAFYELYISKGFDVNLKCDICNGVSPLSMLMPLGAENESLYKRLKSKKYQKGDSEELYTYLEDISFPHQYTWDVITMLLSNGADVNLKDNKGRTPLHWAVLYGQYEFVRYMLESNPELNKNIKDNDGFTALDYALEMRSMILNEEDLMMTMDEIIKILRP